MLKRVFTVRPQPAFTSSALLLLRITAGVAFAIHGSGKIANPFGWMGDGAFAPWLQALAALSEFGGGIAWALGLLTPLACSGIACTMAVAVYTVAVTKGGPFVAAKPDVASWELAAVYFCTALVLMATGPGAFSLDRKFFGVRGQPVSPT